MCEAQGWTAGNFWSVDAQRDTLWHEVGWNSDGDERRSVLNPGDRLPPWLSHGPVWIGDVVRDPRTSRPRARRGHGLEHGSRRFP